MLHNVTPQPDAGSLLGHGVIMLHSEAAAESSGRPGGNVEFIVPVQCFGFISNQCEHFHSSSTRPTHQVFHCSLCAECCSRHRGCCPERHTPDSSSAILNHHRPTTATRPSSHLNTERTKSNQYKPRQKNKATPNPDVLETNAPTQAVSARGH